MSDNSDLSGDETNRPGTADSDDSVEMDMAECERQRNECLARLESLDSQLVVLQDQLFKERLDFVKNYNLSDIHGGKSQAYVGLLQRIQKVVKERKEEIFPIDCIGDCFPRLEKMLPVMFFGRPGLQLADLRNYILEGTSEFKTAIPHTSRLPLEYEELGLDYYFIPREQFRSDKINRKFVEFGEYKGDEFGTSIQAIKEVVRSGKICILKVRQISLKVFRVKDLSPLSVFVAFIEREEFEVEQ